MTLSREDMDIVRGVFGLRFVPGGSPPGCVEVYIEDDESYSLKFTVNRLWLPTLRALTQAAIQRKDM